MWKYVLGFSGVILLFSVDIFAAPKNFDGIQCGSDIAKELMGRSMSNERVVVLENKYKSLGLKNLGGSDEEDLFLTSWLVCGDEYSLLQKKEAVRDVLKLPHSKETPIFLGVCPIRNEPSEEIIAVLKNEGNAENLPAISAWSIDHKKAKFVKLPTEGRLCPRSGIVN